MPNAQNTPPSSGSKKYFNQGDLIMQQGDEGLSAYIIEEGKVNIVVRNKDGHEHSVGVRGPGAMIGEMAIIDHSPRIASVEALENCTLLEITAKDFSRRLDHADPILKMTIQVILTRYRDTLIHQNIAGHKSNFLPREINELNHAQSSVAYENVKIANEFKAALDREEICLHYQPIVNLQDGALIGFESLMRWKHAEHGFISPEIFIPIAEESGVILEASQWALSESCAALSRIEKHAPQKNDLFMSVNFTSRDFTEHDFTDNVSQALISNNLNAKQLHIEITERMLMDQPDQARETLQKCRDAGIDVSIDDFGTGYSSLSYLQYFPISTLKIDRSFVMDMLKNPGSLALVKSIISLGKNMHMHIIAEGVETPEEAQTLKTLGCDMAQGYHFAKPMPESNIIDFIARHK